MSEKLILGENTVYDIENYIGVNSHVCVFGGSGSGKSHSVVKPNLFSFSDAGSSLIISDPKGALEKEFRGYLQNKGYHTYVIDLINPEKSTSSFNPIDYISSEIDFIKLAHRIVYSDPLTRNSTHQDPYWNRQAEILLSMLLELVLMVEDEGKETFDKVMYYASNITTDGTGITNLIMDRIESERKDCLASKQWIKIKGLMSAEKTFSCVVSSLQEHLGRYESEEMAAFFNKKEKIYFETFAREKSALFLKISDTDDTYYDLANIIYGQAIDSVSKVADSTENGRCQIPVRFILDDFATNAWVEGMPRIISTARARNISFMLMCQSVQQLRMGYGDDAQTIITNCDNLVFMGTNDIDTAREFSIRLDLPVSDLLYKKRGRIYVFRAGERPIEDNRYDYRRHTSYKYLEGIKNMR